MPLDPSILTPNATLLQSIANPQPQPTIADMQAKQLALQNARLQSQSTAMDLQQKQTELQEHQQVIQALGVTGGDVEKAIPILQGQGNWRQASVLQKYQAETQTAADNHKKNILDNVQHQASMVGSAANSVLNAPDEIKPIVYQAQKNFLEGNQLVAPGSLPPQYTADMLPQLTAMVDQSQDVKGQADRARAVSEGRKADVETAAKQRADMISTLSTATDDATLQKALTSLKDRGIPAAVLKEFQGQTWTPALGRQLQQLSVSPDKRIEIPVQQAAAIAAQASQANAPLTAAASLGPQQYAAAVQKQPQTVQDMLKGLGPNPSAAAVHRALLPPDKQDQYDNLQSEEKSRQVSNIIAQGHLNVARQELALKQMYAPPATTPGAANITGEDFLKTLPFAVANQVRQIANGDQEVPSASSRNPMAQQIRQAVNQYDPAFNDNRRKTMIEFATGAPGRQVDAVNTAITHLELLQKAGQAMHNGSFVPGNTIYNAFVSTFGNANPSNFDNIAQRVSGELNKATGSKGEKEMEAIKSNLSRSGSDAEINGAVKINLQLLGGAMDSLKHDYVRGTGFDFNHPKVQGLLSPRATTALAGIGFDQNMNPIDKVNVIAPDGRPGTIPASKLAEAQKRGYKLAGTGQ